MKIRNIIAIILVIVLIGALSWIFIFNKDDKSKEEKKNIDQSIAIVKKDYSKEDVTYKFIEESSKNVYKIIIYDKNDKALKIYLVNVKYKTFTVTDITDNPSSGK